VAAAGNETANAERNNTEERSKRAGSVSLAGKDRTAMGAATPGRVHRRGLSADDLGLNGGSQALCFAQRNSQSFGTNDLVSLDPCYLNVIDACSIAEVSDELHPPHKFPHQVNPPKEASLPAKPQHPPRLYMLPCCCCRDPQPQDAVSLLIHWDRKFSDILSNDGFILK
jgi:hypothetical protein